GAGVLSGIETGDSGGFTLNSASGFLPHSQAFNLVLGNSSKGLLGVFSLLESKGFAYTLAEPSLVTMSGQSASFLAGGEFPIPVSQGSSESSSVTIEYKEFGVRLTMSPTVLSEDRIMLKVAPEVSELDFAAGVSSGGVTVPALRVRRADTSVELGDGESFVIAGLISQDTMANVDKFPGLGDLPVLGALFRSSRIQKDDRELVMIVTPHLVRPLARGSRLPPLPGERYRTYDKDFADQLFNETGEFENDAPVLTGFSD
ncbi:MAG TPA: type II and III secretion system protein family protein, partial [Gammaproteobacteria bacterium]